MDNYTKYVQSLSCVQEIFQKNALFNDIIKFFASISRLEDIMRFMVCPFCLQFLDSFTFVIPESVVKRDVIFQDEKQSFLKKISSSYIGCYTVLYWCVFTSKYIGTESMITEFFKESKVFTAEIIVNDKLTFTRWTWQSLSATNSQIQKRDYFSNLKLRVKNHQNG